MSDDEDIAALVVDNGSGMCKGKKSIVFPSCLVIKKNAKADDDDVDDEKSY